MYYIKYALYFLLHLLVMLFIVCLNASVYVLNVYISTTNTSKKLF